MFKRFIYLTAVICIACAVLCSCGKKVDEEAQEKVKEVEIKTFTEGVSVPPKPAPLPADLVIDVPGPIKAKYKAVVMGVGNRKTKEVKKFTVKLGGTAKVPGTGYTIKVFDYLPNWTFRGKVVTSKDDKPEDPAVRAEIYEKGKKVFDGFIFQKHKTPSFVTDEYAVGLLEAVSR